MLAPPKTAQGRGKGGQSNVEKWKIVRVPKSLNPQIPFQNVHELEPSMVHGSGPIVPQSGQSAPAGARVQPEGISDTVFVCAHSNTCITLTLKKGTFA